MAIVLWIKRKEFENVRYICFFLKVKTLLAFGWSDIELFRDVWKQASYCRSGIFTIPKISKCGCECEWHMNSKVITFKIHRDLKTYYFCENLLIHTFLLIQRTMAENNIWKTNFKYFFYFRKIGKMLLIFVPIFSFFTVKKIRNKLCFRHIL